MTDLISRTPRRDYTDIKLELLREDKVAKEAAEKQGQLDAVYAGAQMPDEELIRRNERRKAAKRRGSRQRNVLTDEDSLG